MKKNQQPSQQDLSTLLRQQLDAADLVGDLQHSASRLIAQQALEAEASANPGREWYRHRQNQEAPRGHRNGYERA